jgi:hypothetical protein
MQRSLFSLEKDASIRKHNKLRAKILESKIHSKVREKEKERLEKAM